MAPTSNFECIEFRRTFDRISTIDVEKRFASKIKFRRRNSNLELADLEKSHSNRSTNLLSPAPSKTHHNAKKQQSAVAAFVGAVVGVVLIAFGQTC